MTHSGSRLRAGPAVVPASAPAAGVPGRTGEPLLPSSHDDWDLEDDVRSVLWHIHTRPEGRAWMARVLAAYELHGPLLHQAVATTEPDSPERTAALAVSREMLERA